MLVADECWIALAALHRKFPEREGFFSREIFRQVTADATCPVRAGVQPHISQHNVANVKPSSARYRMFFRLPSGELRLYRPGDAVHPDRRGKLKPEAADLPEDARYLLKWYEEEYAGSGRLAVDPVLAMIGVGRELWAEEDGDTFIRRERSPENWSKSDLIPAADELWQRLLSHEGQIFHTATGKPFRYRVDGNGIYFDREGHTVNKRLSRADFEKAAARLPLTRASDVKDCLDPPHLFALLTDSRIVHTADRAA